MCVTLNWGTGFPEIYACLEVGGGVNLPWVYVHCAISETDLSVHINIWSQCALHLKILPSCSLHLNPEGGYIWVWALHLKILTHFGFRSQCALHLKSWPSCSLHLKTWHNSALCHKMSLPWGVYLISGCTSSDKLTISNGLSLKT